MSTTTPPVSAGTSPKAPAIPAGTLARKKLSKPWASLAAIVLAVLWTIPTFGLLVSSFRPERAIKTTGWWTFFSDPQVTLANYEKVLASEGANALFPYFVNSFIIVIPAVVIPMTLATLASYAIAWIDFKGRDVLFVAIFALQIVPIQVTLIPLLTLFVDLGIAGEFASMWLAHSTFALPLAIFLLHNFMREIPRELIEAARVDGAGHVKILFSVLLPLLAPALAAFGIFQFLWVWNDLLVGLVFGGSENRPITVALSNLAGTRGTAWHLLSAGAFVSIIVPLVVFLSLQRYFVKGLLAGGLKG
ncbi:alpha-glucoside transport system permease protein [Kineococcus xinjiangensis]|uniref:Alpha-glucoside transport system permease protein n=1 Tax=Kineococcus xinjiangensis TaxID=512762 RepID=A0A2S6IKC1_9ACTN|nr:carbohydrate ABC transporter permease [Kineococcus xinjiangensis]PPK94677.1 alpha-glucoside transport system permease protein [Kineococcus xinjiangensis]